MLVWMGWYQKNQPTQSLHQTTVIAKTFFLHLDALPNITRLAEWTLLVLSPFKMHKDVIACL